MSKCIRILSDDFKDVVLSENGIWFIREMKALGLTSWKNIGMLICIRHSTQRYENVDGYTKFHQYFELEFSNNGKVTQVTVEYFNRNSRAKTGYRLPNE